MQRLRSRCRQCIVPLHNSFSVCLDTFIQLKSCIEKPTECTQQYCTRAGYAQKGPLLSRHCTQARILLSSDKRPASYMRMFYVSSQATKQVATRLWEGEADDVAGYVIDLRNNPGTHPAWRPCIGVHIVPVCPCLASHKRSRSQRAYRAQALPDAYREPIQAQKLRCHV